MFKKIIEKLQYGSCKVKIDKEPDITKKAEKKSSKDVEK